MDVKNMPTKLNGPKADEAIMPMINCGWKKRRTMEPGTEHPPLYTSEAEEVKDKQLSNSGKSITKLNLSCITYKQSLMNSRHNKQVRKSSIIF